MGWSTISSYSRPATGGGSYSPPASRVDFLGDFDPTVPSPNLQDGIGNIGDQYKVSADGSHDFGSGSMPLTVGCIVQYNGSVWFVASGHEQVIDFPNYEATDTYHYYGGTVDGEWRVNRVPVAAPTTKETATEANNPGVTDLASAWVARATTLVYA